MPKSKPPRRQHPRPWRKDSTFLPPKVRRLSAPALRAWRGFVGTAKRARLLTADRLRVSVQLLQTVGWRGQQQVSLAELGAAADNASVSTVGRTLNDLEGFKLIKRHHLIKKGDDGRTVQDETFFELIEPVEESDRQAADALAPDGLQISFLAAEVRRKLWITPAVERGGEAPPSSGDDEWGFWNGAQQIEALGMA